MPFTRAVGGGSFASASLLAKGLIDLGHEVVALFPQQGPSAELFHRQGVPVRVEALPVVAPVKRSPWGLCSFLKGYLATAWAARRFLLENEFDIVHCNDDTSILPWGLAARVLDKRCIWHVRTGRAGRTDQVRLRLADKAICISLFVGNRLPDTPKKLTLYNPVDTKVFGPVADKIMQRQTLGLPKSGLQLIQIGRDVAYKRPEWSVKALTNLLRAGVRARLVFLGEFTPQRQAMLRAMLPPANQDRLVFLGWVSNPQDYLACSDLLLHPADGEHFGRIFIEAAACGVPFIATNTGAAPELVAAGLYGELYDDWETPNLLGDVFSRLRADNSDSLSSKFDVTQSARQFDAVIRRLI